MNQQLSDTGIGRHLFNAARLCHEVLQETDAMFHQLGSMFQSTSLNEDGDFREIKHLDSACWYEDDSKRITYGGLMNFAVWMHKEKTNTDPKHCVSVFVQLYPGHDETPDDPLLVHEALVHVIYSSDGPWTKKDDQPITLSPTKLTGDYWHDMTDALWCYDHEEERYWVYSFPLTEINSGKDLRRLITKPASRLIVSSTTLPNKEEAEAALRDLPVIRYKVDGNRITVVAPQRLATAG